MVGYNIIYQDKSITPGHVISCDLTGGWSGGANGNIDCCCG